MPPELNLLPRDAWTSHIGDSIELEKWVEDGDPISDSVALSKRELLGLILYSYRLDEQGQIRVCWDSQDQEPNDGFLSLPDSRVVRCEHKLVTQYEPREILESITETYEKYAHLGPNYASNVHLIIHVNRQSVGLEKVSDLHYAIGDSCEFKKVFMASVNGFEGLDVIRFALDEHFPGLDLKHLPIDRHTGELKPS